MTRAPDRDLQALLAEEPFVRGLACALASNDADDVAQQTFLMALQHRGPVQQPRSWLHRIATNVAKNLARGERRRGERERTVAVRERVPSSAELMEREERRSALVRAVDRLPVELREVVLLRWFEGLPPRRIAVALGLPVTTVWNRLRSALQRLREGLDREHGGDRRAWLLPLLPFRMARGEPVPALPVLLAGGVAMTGKSKVAVVLGVLLLLAGVYAVWPEAGVGAALPAGAGAMVTAKEPFAAGGSVAGTPEPARVLAPTLKAAESGAGSLLVRVIRGDDQSRAAGETLVLLSEGSQSPLAERYHRTDEEGQVRVDALAPGTMELWLMQYPRRQKVEIRAGQITEFDCVVPAGVAVRGIVVDRDDRPIAGAEVDLFDFMSHSPATVTRTDVEGRFAVRHVWPISMIGARSAEHAPSRLQMLMSSEGGTAEVKIQLLEAGGVLEGTVWDPAGRPVHLAAVRVGVDPSIGYVSSLGVDPVPVPVRTDALGRFRAVGLKVGEQPVVVQAAGLTPWQGQCFIAARATVSLRIDLSAGAMCKGVVRDEAGTPLGGVRVSAGDRSALTGCSSETTGDGAFTLTGLATGELEIHAWHEKLGESKAVVTARAGETVNCDLVLSRGIELRGRVLDESGAPVRGAWVHAFAAGGTSSGNTDDEGRFTLINCPAGLLTVGADLGGREARRERVDPKQGEVELRLPVQSPRKPASVRIRGQLIGPDGLGAARVTVSTYTGAGEDMSSGVTAADGTFTLGPVRPGRRQVYVPAQRYPTWSSEWRELAEDAVWDVGRVQLVEGGTALFQVSGAPAGARIEFSIDTGKRPRASGQWIGERSLRTFALQPGDYQVWFSCEGCARRPVPFTIRPGEETRVEARLEPGVRQRLEFVRGDGARVSDDVSHGLRRGNEVLIEMGHSVYWNRPPVYAADGAMTAELWLAPGAYRLDVGERTVAGSAEFTVTASEGPPLRIVLR